MGPCALGAGNGAEPTFRGTLWYDSAPGWATTSVR